jgi:hypothetical protein
MAEPTEERFDRVGIYEIYRVASSPCAWGPRATEIMAMFRLRPHASDDTASQGACGCAAPGSREPRRCASRPFGFDPSRKDHHEHLAGGSRSRVPPKTAALC